MANKFEQEIKGDSNTQQYIENQYNYQSDLTEEKVREISMASARFVASEYFAISQDMANFRMKNFEDVVLNRFNVLENGLNAFKDPAFMLLYRKAQIQAAVTDNEDNYKTLSELLIHRQKKKDDKYSQTGINGAVEIVNEISDSSLEALTILNCFVMGIVPETGSIEIGVQVLEKLYSSIMTDELPKNNLWMEQLDILKAVRINNFSKFNKFEDIIYKQLAKYIVVGIEKNSENYKKANEILMANNIKIFIDNPLCPNYVYIPYTQKEISKLSRNVMGLKIPLNENEIKAINSLYELYNNDEQNIKLVKENLIKMMDTFEHLKKIHNWWNSLSTSCDITVIGRVLAHVNAKKCYAEFPPLDY